MNLFGEIETVEPMPKANRRAWKGHRSLIAMHGTTEGKKCGSCIHLRWKDGKYPKCLNNSANGGGSASTDHSSRWQACGLWKEEVK
jgi:hypothetical protein